MFIHLSEKERHAALSICILCAPVEDTPEIEQHELEQTSWRNDFLSTFGTEVGMDSDDINLQLTRCPSRFDESGEIRRERERSFKHYCEVLRSVGFSDKELVACILAIIVELKSEFCKFVQVQHGRLVHAEDLKEDPFRYAKIGAVAVGAGALLVVTAGLAAPAVAGALVLMGTSSVAAAGIASGMVVVFGGTGAGLAGYRMQSRTQGLTDFAFQQYDEKDKMEVVIMVSGWMEEEEDDKRTFGVVPEQMSLRERLTRFYRVHDIGRLAKVDNEAKCFEDDPNALFEQIRDQYGYDPTFVENLTPAARYPPTHKNGGVVSNDYFDLVEECFSRRTNGATGQHRWGTQASEDQRGSAGGRSVPAAAGTTSMAMDGPVHLAEEEDLPVAILVEAPANDPALSPYSQSGILAGPPPAGVIDLDQQQREAEPVHLVNEFPYWHWRELSVSPIYELTLLHWERQLQRDLGKSILNLVTTLSAYAAETALQYTILSALVAAVALPVFLLNLTSAIDNTWLIASERAKAAGKEMAKALLERPQGSRPVTLVGYSMGCRVIFECLKELSLRLEEMEKVYADNAAAAAGAKADAERPPTEAGRSGMGGYFGFGGLFGSATSATPPPDKSCEGGKRSGGSTDPVTERDAEESKNAVKSARELKAIVKDVVLLGAPLNLKSSSWAKIRRVVGGRLVNGYSAKDLVLSVVYRYERYKFSVAGLGPVQVAGVQNVDLSDMVTQHTHYCTKMKEILELIDLASPESCVHYCAAPTVDADCVSGDPCLDSILGDLPVGSSGAGASTLS